VRPSAVLFDLDGTLLDTLRDIADATNEALARLGFPPHPVERYRHLVGEGVVVLLERALPREARDRASVARGVEAFRESYGRRWDRATRPYPGVEALLEGLAVRAVPAAVLSNKPDDFVRKAVERFLGRFAFAAVEGVRADGRRKPDPSLALGIASGLGVLPGAVLLVGDTRIDVLTAVAAGMVPVGATWGFRDARELRESGAAHLVDRPEDVLALLDAPA